MYRIIYRNDSSGVVMCEYCFASYEERRRNFLMNHPDFTILSVSKLPGSWWHFLWVLFNNRKTKILRREPLDKLHRL